MAALGSCMAGTTTMECCFPTDFRSKCFHGSVRVAYGFGKVGLGVGLGAPRLLDFGALASSSKQRCPDSFSSSPFYKGSELPRAKSTGSRLLSRRVSLMASLEDSAASIDGKAEEATKELEDESQRSKEALNAVVENFKDEVLKLQDSTKQMYAESSEKAIGVLRETTEQLREQAEKARVILLAAAQETAERGKENLTSLAENSPDPFIQDVAKAALNAHYAMKAREGAKIHDFCLGIPYGALLVAGGFLSFLITGGTDGLRFGVVLGGLLLTLSIMSLKAWKKGHSSLSHVKGQAAITLILFIRELRRYTETRNFVPAGVASFLSGVMLAFYGYMYLSGGNPPKKAKTEPSPEAA